MRVTYQVLGRKQPWKRKLLKFPTRCRISNFNLFMQISPCLQNVAPLLKKTQNNRLKSFAAKHFIQINNTFAFSSEKLYNFLCAWTHACNFCRYFTWLNGDRLLKPGVEEDLVRAAYELTVRNNCNKCESQFYIWKYRNWNAIRTLVKVAPEDCLLFFCFNHGWHHL